MIRDRLDPDALYPARLAGPHAWAAWGLSSPADARRLELVVPARYPHSTVDELLGRIAALLATPVWPAREAPQIDVRGRTLRYLDDGQPTTVELLDLPWYQPASPGHPAGAAVTVDGWPIIDETAATRQRFEAIAEHGATGQDVTDIARWIQLHTGKRPAHRHPPTRVRDLLTHVHHDGPVASRGIDMVIAHARATHQRQIDAGSIRSAFQTLTDEIARITAKQDHVMSRR